MDTNRNGKFFKLLIMEFHNYAHVSFWLPCTRAMQNFLNGLNQAAHFV